MILDGRKTAEEIFFELIKERTLIDRDIFLGVIAAGNNPVIDSFVRIKERAAERLNVTLVRENLGEEAATQDAADLALHLSGQCDGVVVQLPLPIGIDADTVLANILPDKDVDDINPATADLDKRVRAPVVEAIAEIFARHDVAPLGKKACVVGNGRLVGHPAALWLEAEGADVSIITNKKGSMEELKEADIIISGAGEPGLIKPEMIHEGCVLIDAGTSEAEGKISGDADPACAEKCALFTPVPGGVGPLAVAMLFKNLFTLAKK